MSKLGTTTINGHPVSFFEPPHPEPDFPWVDVEELAAAFLPPDAAKRMVEHAHSFDRESRPVATCANGDRIATIMCHAMAQGLCGAIDQWNGHADAGEEWGGGPAQLAYSVAAARFAADHWPLNFDGIVAAFRNVGGPFMRSSGDGK